LQSPATSHSTHCPAELQIGSAVFVQSAAVRHATQILFAVEQKGVGAAQFEFAVHALVHCLADTLHV
jgi:hypothetical protein